MAFSKADTFDKTLYQQAFWSKVLGHPARIIILAHLLRNGPTTFDVFNRKIHLAPSTISQHLVYLIKAGVIRVQTKFPKAVYALEQKMCKLLAEKIWGLHREFIGVQ